MTADATPDRESRSSDEIFRLLSEEFSRNVVTRALQHRAAAKGARKQLNASVRRLQLDGFRDASRAPHQRLLRPVLDAIDRGDRPLARAVLNTWMDSHEALRNAAAAHLADRGIPAPEPPDACFESSWTTDEWLRERHAMTADDGALDAEETGLMLCLLSRRFPAPPPLESPYFNEWLDELWLLPPEAPEWAEVDAFTKWVQDVRRAKHRELFHWLTDAIALVCDDIRTRFDEDLRYLDVDPGPWANAVEQRPRLAGPALALVKTLREALEAYQPVRPQGTSRDEELQRSETRRLREDDILGLVAEWEELVARPDPVVEESAPAADAEGDQPPADPAGAVDEDQQAGVEPLKVEHEQVQHEMASLRDEGDRLREQNRGLQSEKTQRDQEIDRLKDELSRSRRTEEHWRRTYVDEKRRSRTPGGDDAVAVESVREAIVLAQETFPDRLLIKLNSKSDQDTSFESPDEVFDVLAWLATAYGEAPPDLIAEACPGWFYKPNQSETTMGRYRDWYRTRVDGTTWELSSHVGKGSSRDPRHTIRIAFARDEASGRVIVGFVGVHQRNRQS